MESLVTEAGFVVDDDLLNFSLDGEEEPSNPAAAAAAATALCRAAHTGSFPEFVEEELEWLSNKDAFPAVETCFGILSDNPGLILNHQSPVSVLENSNSSISAGSNGSGSNGGSSGGSIASCCNSIKVPTKYPVRARSKRRRRRRTGFTDLPSQQQCVWMNQVNVVVKNKKQESQLSLPPLPLAAATTADSGGGGGTAGGGMGRRCWHCQADKTPQWRAGPMGPKTLCNACGVRYKSGRLLPEYRPANSPTFSSNLHSNSHRKVVEMRRQKQAVVVPGEGIEVNVSCGYFG